MLRSDALPVSSFGDAYKGVKFTIRLKSYGNKYTASLEVVGLPSRAYSDKSWDDKNEAIEDIRADARTLIDGMKP